MVTRSTADETILQSDRVPVFLGVNRFYLKKGLQSSNRSIDTPNEVVKEQGNELNRGVSIQAPQITVSFEDLAVDLDMEQLLSESWATVGSRTGSATLSGLIVHKVGPTDKITGMVVSYVSGGFTRIGEGCLVSAVTATTIKLASAGHAVNFAEGDQVITQKVGGVTNKSGVTATITRISGAFLTTTGFNHSTLSAGTIYVYVKDDYPISSADFVSGLVAKSLKGLEVYVKASNLNAKTTNIQIAYYPVTVSGTSTDIDSNDFRSSEIDAVMLYNDYDDNLIFSRYMQGLAVTSIGFNYTADGNATQTYDFQTGKSMDYVGYVNRRSAMTSGVATTFKVGDLKGIFVGSEVNDPIATNTTLNENTFPKNFLKVQTLTTGGVRKTWTEVASGTTTLGTDNYKYVNATKLITFGESIAAETRIEFTYLCDAAYVSDTNAYKFDATAFSHTGTPDVVTGKYQPLTINSSNFDDRIDGVESTTFTLGFTRDYYNAQGIIAQRVKPAQIGSIDGSFTTREGFSKVMSSITLGTYTDLANKAQMDASKAATFTNTNSIPLRVRLYDPKTNINEIKTVECSEIQVTTISNSNSVGDDSTFEVSFIGTKGNLKFSR